MPFSALSGLEPGAGIVLLAYAFALGTMLGSFINVCVFRLPQGRSIVWPGSACPSCGTPLRWWQNLPLVSFLILGGKCHYCFGSISLRYFAIELLMGLLTGAVFLVWGLSWTALYALLFIGICLVVFLIDLDHWLILDQVTLPGIVVGFLCSLILPPGLLDLLGNTLGLPAPFLINPAASLAGLVGGFLLFWVIARVGEFLAHREAMGEGDLKFAALMGAFLGWQQAGLAFMIAFFIGALVSLPLLLFRSMGRKDPIPFGTFLALAAVVVLFWGRVIMNGLLNWPGLFYTF